jgi:phosphopantetheine adenylyltransferase
MSIATEALRAQYAARLSGHKQTVAAAKSDICARIEHLVDRVLVDVAEMQAAGEAFTADDRADFVSLVTAMEPAVEEVRTFILAQIARVQ